MKTGDKTGLVAGALAVRDTDDLMLITTKGKMVRTRVHQIRETSRNTMGVKLIELKPGSKLQAIAPVVSMESENEPILEGLEIPPPEE
jgi:DNA gyrase subunit A